MEHDSWEPEPSLACPEIISKFQEFKKNKREAGKRGTPKKPLYTEVGETEGEDVRSIYVTDATKRRAQMGKAAKGKQTGKAKKGQTKQKDEEEDYEVEEIVGEKMEKGKKYYFLKWKGLCDDALLSNKIIIKFIHLVQVLHHQIIHGS